MRRLLAVAGLLLLTQSVARAQTVRGIVVDAGDRPVSGVVVLLLDSASRPAVRSLSNDKGEFRLVAPAAVTYRLQTMRIGFRPALSDPIKLAMTDEITRRIPLAGVAFALDTIRSQSRNACKMSAADSTTTVAMLWEQVRTALNATLITAASRSIVATTVGFDRTYDPGLKRIRHQTSDVRSDYVSQPWSSIKPESLRQVGYVVTEHNDLRKYYAPGFDMLLSDAFVADHCFKIETTKDPTRVGISFEPSPDRKKLPEIRGTLWVDRKSAELRSMEYRYVNVPREERDNAGGEMEFVRMRNGMWAISRWSIRMPTIVLVPIYETRGTRILEVGRDPRVDSIKVTGGELSMAMLSAMRGGNDTLWSRPRLTLTGTVLDSLTNKPVPASKVAIEGTVLESVADAAGRFRIPGMLPGRYAIEVHTPSLDSVNTVSQSDLLFTDSATVVTLKVPTGAQIAASFCGNPALVGTTSKEGVVFGTVSIPGDTSTAAAAVVTAEWKEVKVHQAAGSSTPGVDVYNQPRVSDIRSDASGNFRICGVPLKTALTLHAVRGAASSNYLPVRIPDSQRFTRIELSLDQVRADGAILVGMVVADTTNRPLDGAEVAFPDLTLSTRTDSTGAFRLAGIPSGSQRLIVRHIGYGGLDTRIAFTSNDRVERKVVLNKITVLDSVVTVGSAVRTRNWAAILDRKRSGLGYYRDSTQMIQTSDVARVFRGINGVVVTAGKPPQILFHAPPCNPVCDQRGESMCLANVFIDGVRVDQGELLQLYVDKLALVEIYPRMMNTPPQFVVRGTQASDSPVGAVMNVCGTIVAWTKRVVP